MKRANIKLLSLVLALSIIFNMYTTVHASDVSELKGHWAEKTLTEWIELGLLKGDSNGRYNPDSKITRAEFMALVNRVMNYTEKSDSISNFSDVSPNKWYYDDVSKALAAGYINGTSATTLSPEDTITREQTITIISRIQGISPDGDIGILAIANDSAEISAWARGPVAGAIREGLVTGSNGNINPGAKATRCEAIVLLDRVRTNTRMYNFAGTYGPETGTAAAGNVIIAASGIRLQNTLINGDLEIAQTAAGEVTLNSVVVRGNLVVNGVSNPLYLSNVTVDGSIIVGNRNTGTPRIIVSGNSNVALAQLESGATLVIRELSGNGIQEVVIAEGFSGNNPVELVGRFNTVTNRKPNTEIILTGSDIGILNLVEAAVVEADESSTIGTAKVSRDAGGSTSINIRPNSIVGDGAQYAKIVAAGTPTQKPTAAPGSSSPSTPVSTPTKKPTQTPTSNPTKEPTQTPTKAPTSAPTKTPTQTPTKAPTSAPTKTPTQTPTKTPTPTPAAQAGNIKVLPGVHVEVGEEVYFDGAYYQNGYNSTVQWEWDFGDGYTLKAGEPSRSTFDTGLCVVHYFMKPGEYEVKLSVSKFDMTKSPPERQELIYTDSVTIHVTGEAPIDGFELRHAPFHARTAQYLYAVVPPDYSPSQVSARLESSNGTLIQHLNGVTTEDGKQRFLLENAKLTAGDYVVVAELKNGQETVSIIREKFSKPYNGAPEVGINENNAFILNGKDLFFPIGPYMLNKDLLPVWKAASNTLHTLGYYPVKDDAAWQDYVTFSGSEGLKAIGPTGWTESNLRNSNPADMTKYTDAAKNLEGLFGWCWDDEPNIGGRYGCVPATVLAAWSYWISRLDSQHPTIQQYYGYDYLPHYNPLKGNHSFSYMRSESLFGKKAFTADFITYDIYPVEYKEHPSLDYSNRGVIDLWAEGLDNFIWNMDNLIPLGTFVETQNVTSWNRISNYDTTWDAGPTPGDLRTQLWTAIVHNMKAVQYFEFFSSTPLDNMSVLNEFNEAVTDLTPIILAPPSSLTVTHNCNTRGNRVDLMVRETPADYYIFAVRVTEPESEWNEVPEPETIEFEFSTGTQATTAYDIFPGYRWEYQLFDVTENKTSFQLDLEKDGIRPGSVLIAAVESVPDGTPDKLIDRWTGKDYSAVLDRTGALIYGYDDGQGKIIPLYNWKNIKSGTINYETGELSVEFNNNVPLGESFIQVAYAVEDRPTRTINGSGGVFKDTLERNAVRIYRVPKVSP